MLYGTNSISQGNEKKQQTPSKGGINPETDSAGPRSLLGIYIEEKRNRPAELNSSISMSKSTSEKKKSLVQFDLDADYQ